MQVCFCFRLVVKAHSEMKREADSSVYELFVACNENDKHAVCGR